MVIGCGSIGSRHVRNLLALGVNVAVVDSDPAALARIRWAHPAVDLLDSSTGPWHEPWRADAVVIATPADAHAVMAMLLRIGSYAGPLFVEKPIVTSLADADVFRDWPHPVQMVGYMLRFHPQAQRMHAAIAPAAHVSCHVECDMATWPGGAKHGDPLLECSHELDLALWCGASPTVRDFYTLRRGAAAFNLGKNGTVTMDWTSPRYRREWDGVGEQIGFQWRFDSPEELGDEMYEREIAHFLECVKRGELLPPAASFADGLKVVEVIEQARTVTA